MTDEEIEQLFQKPVITDAMAVDKLEKRGFGGLFPVESQENRGFFLPGTAAGRKNMVALLCSEKEHRFHTR